MSRYSKVQVIILIVTNFIQKIRQISQLLDIFIRYYDIPSINYYFCNSYVENHD